MTGLEVVLRLRREDVMKVYERSLLIQEDREAAAGQAGLIRGALSLPLDPSPGDLEAIAEELGPAGAKLLKEIYEEEAAASLSSWMRSDRSYTFMTSSRRNLRSTSRPVIPPRFGLKARTFSTIRPMLSTRETQKSSSSSASAAGHAFASHSACTERIVSSTN